MDLDTENRASSEPRLFVRHVGRTRRTFLERLFRLDTWRDTLLGTKVADEMATGYIILAVVFVFEVCAWTLLFSFLFHGAAIGLSWKVIPAFVVGLLWGLGIYTIDKGLITSDLLRPGIGKWLGFGGRIVLVLASAVFTAQPIEQVVFHAQIDRRVKEETLREDAVKLASQFSDRKKEVKESKNASLSNALTEAAKGSWQEAEDRQARAEDAEGKAEGDLKTAVAALQRKIKDREKVIADLEASQTSDDQDRVRDLVLRRKRLDTAIGKLGQEKTSAEAAANQAREKAIRAKARVNDSHTTLETVTTDVTKLHKGAVAASQAKVAEFQKFFGQLQAADFGDPLTMPNGERYRWKPVDFIDRQLVLTQLQQGLPPRWPRESVAAMAPDVRAALDELHLPLADAPVDRAAAESMTWLYLAVMLIAAAVPSLSIFYKLTMSDELKAYYSVQCQADAGNPDAIIHQAARARGRARRPSRRWWVPSVGGGMRVPTGDGMVPE